MSYKIKLIDNCTIENRKYFFDANIWLMILKPKITPTPREQKYLNFLERFKTSNQNPKIVIPSLVLSEVINRYLRDVGMERYIKKKNIAKPTPPDFYKKQYRPSQEFKNDYQLLCDDINDFSVYYEFVSDQLGDQITSEDVLLNPPKGLDFNDHYYYLLAKKENYIIVTDDADFFVEDVDILTNNITLYQKGKDSVLPKKA